MLMVHAWDQNIWLLLTHGTQAGEPWPGHAFTNLLSGRKIRGDVVTFYLSEVMLKRDIPDDFVTCFCTRYELHAMKKF